MWTGWWSSNYNFCETLNWNGLISSYHRSLLGVFSFQRLFSPNTPGFSIICWIRFFDPIISIFACLLWQTFAPLLECLLLSWYSGDMFVLVYLYFFAKFWSNGQFICLFCLSLPNVGRMVSQCEPPMVFWWLVCAKDSYLLLPLLLQLLVWLQCTALTTSDAIRDAVIYVLAEFVR